MRNLLIILIILFAIKSNAQIQNTKVTFGDKELRNIPRLSVDIGLPVNIMGPYSIIPSQAAFLESGLFVTNNGLIYEQDDLRYIPRIVGLNIPLRVGKIVNEKYYLGIGNNFNFPIHYKLKTFTAGSRDNKQIVTKEYFSKKVAKFYPSMELSAGISIHTVGRISIRFQMYYLDFFNPAYTEIQNGVEVKPYETLLLEQKFRIILSYNSGL